MTFHICYKWMLLFISIFCSLVIIELFCRDNHNDPSLSILYSDRLHSNRQSRLQLQVYDTSHLPDFELSFTRSSSDITTFFSTLTTSLSSAPNVARSSAAVTVSASTANHRHLYVDACMLEEQVDVALCLSTPLALTSRKSDHGRTSRDFHIDRSERYLWSSGRY
jgi:hypothetical protein